MRCAEKPQQRRQQSDSETLKLEDPGLNSLEQLQLALPTLPSPSAKKCTELPGQEGGRLGVPAGRLPALHLHLQTRPPASQGTCHTAGLGHQQEGRTPLALAGRERVPSGSAAVHPFCAWYSDRKLMRVWRAVRKITASFLVRTKARQNELKVPRRLETEGRFSVSPGRPQCQALQAARAQQSLGGRDGGAVQTLF